MVVFFSTDIRPTLHDDWRNSGRFTHRRVLWGTLSGSMLPIVLKKAGADPAVSSAPFVATLVDVTGLIIYFSVAYFFLEGLLL
jgi:Mg/Co/Ni transporter MgtE